MTVKHCRDEANCEGQASFLNFFLTASFLLSVQCHGALMHANKLLHGSRSVVKVNQCGMNFRKYANEAKYGPLGSRHLLMRHVGTTTIWGQDQQNKKSNNYFWSEGEKKKASNSSRGCAAATRTACKQVQLSRKQHLWPSAEQMWKMELLFSPNWTRRTNTRVLSCNKMSLFFLHLDKMHLMYN